MIVDLSARLQERLRIATDQEYAQRQTREVREVRDKLDQMAHLFARFEERYRALYATLSSQQHADIQQNAKKIGEALEAQRDNLSKNRRSVGSNLTQANEQIKGMTANLDQHWMITTSEQLQSHQALLAILSRFVEIAPQLAPLHTRLSELQKSARTVPTSETQVDTFLIEVKELAAELSAVPGLSDDVRSFLARASTGQATLNDLSDEVLAWCRHYGERFTITLI